MPLLKKIVFSWDEKLGIHSYRRIEPWSHRHFSISNFFQAVCGRDECLIWNFLAVSTQKMDDGRIHHVQILSQTMHWSGEESLSMWNEGPCRNIWCEEVPIIPPPREEAHQYFQYHHRTPGSTVFGQETWISCETRLLVGFLVQV